MPDDAPIPEPTALERAQRRLVQAALAQPINPATVGISAYANGVLHSARLDAVIDLLLDHERPPTQELLDAAIVRAMERKAEQLEAEARRGQLIQGVRIPPRELIVRGG